MQKPKHMAIKIQEKSVNDDIPTNLPKRSLNSCILISQNSQLCHQEPLEITIPKKRFEAKRPPFNNYEIIIELGTMTLFIFTWVYFFQQYFQLSDRITIYFELSTFDNINKQYFMFILLGDLVFYILLTLLQFITHKFKYVIELRETNAKIVFKYTRYFIAWYKLVTIIVILYITIAVFKIISRAWDAGNIYNMAYFSLAYIAGGWIYYKKLNEVSNNPFI